MSDTKRYIRHNTVINEILTEKYQSRDQSCWLDAMSKNHRYTKHGKNSHYNLEQKNEKLALKEHLDI